ncbi:hypothetical protein R3W88_016485 [Solanum pinnatisectum]|uniref:START domain-containing protein n=1 Tax=Solanum pinnatisectum TaxID=50273 RepID=A0AAV9KXI6_9SOLN|nr:hypothetical protein R3W88_016485 [Solanum pinnatisectum]
MIGGPREDENEDNFITNNTEGGASGDELNSPRGKSLKRKKYSANQIQELEVVFKENSHPDEKTRLELATKFFLQLERHDNRMLKQENDKLHIEYVAMKEVTGNSICDPCCNKDTIRNESIDENEIMNEYARLKNELTKIVVHADKFLGPSAFLEGSLTSMMENFCDINVVDDVSNEVDFRKDLSSPLPIIYVCPTTILVNKDVTLDKSMLLNLALDALNGLLKLKLGRRWGNLNIEEYGRYFIPIIGIKPSHFTTEATRSFGIVDANSLTLVETLMNKNMLIFSNLFYIHWLFYMQNQWVEMFPCIIGKVNTFDVISTGIGERKSGTMLLIETELQIISNVVSISEIQFLRFCQKHAEGTWIIVDVSVDIIQEGSQQYKVFRIEHMEYDEIFIHPLYRPLIRAGLELGAQRWMTSLQRQSKFLRVMTSDSIVDSKGEIGIGILAQRMTHKFCAGICATSHKSQWDILFYNGPMQTIIHISKGQNLEGNISLLCANGDDIIANQNNMLILQDIYADVTGYLLVYAIVDSSKMNTLMKGGDSFGKDILPNRISIALDLS